MVENGWGKLFIVIVTFNRVELLSRLLESIEQMGTQPFGVVVVNNLSTDNTATVLDAWVARSSSINRIVSHQTTNTGGAGGFSAGTKLAYENGADWVWVMDDDVVVEPDALIALEPWGRRFNSIIPRRHDVDGSVVYWQPTISSRMGIAPLRGTDHIDGNEFLPATTGCFEGMMFSREVIETVGFPDPRFFITWDDATYGWLVSRYFEIAYVNEFALRRTRVMPKIDGSRITLSGRSDMSRFYAMRNRGILANYFKSEQSYHPIAFSLGTAITLAKELIRCVLVERKLSGIPRLFSGMSAGRQIRREIGWKPWSEIEPVN